MNYETTEDRIVSALGKISLEKDVSIIYACESGSRAWGFASKDSDYDVRFVYAKHLDEYLSIDACGQRDVIDGVDIEWQGEKLDIAGWDLRKALNLFRKGNPPFLEWINSPIKYVDRFRFAHRCNALGEQHLNKQTIVMHYIHMAFGNWRQYLLPPEDEVPLKKYLYVARPLCAALYLTDTEYRVNYPLPLVPPIDFMALLDNVVLPKEVDLEIRGLVLAKMAGGELASGPRIGVLDEWILALKEQWNEAAEIKKLTVPLKELNDLFREMLEITI